MAFINHTHEFIFIGNARCGSTSMYKQIEKLSKNDIYLWGGLNAKPHEYHAGIGEIIDTYPELNSYFKFAFTRNPWCRFFSSYNEFIKSNHREWNSDIKKYKDFNSFCLNFDKSSLSSDIHFLPISNQITIDGKLAIDFVGRFENIEEDFKKITKIIKEKTKLKFHSRPTKSNCYKGFYNNETRNIIERFYKMI